MKKSPLENKFKVKPIDKKRYVLSTDADYEILGKIYALEAKKLSQRDRELVKFVRTQLEHNWRTPIIKLLNKMSKDYE
ncbi:hypothetical protein HYZ64_00750 [Candidatus Berkelbacteria bacterium]|nr:hypothetical protein [Candidatus Berkelbacteria bacterium]